MRVLALVLSLVGCEPAFEEPAPIAWNEAGRVAVTDAAEMWQGHGAKVACDWLDELHMQCQIRGQSWLVGLGATKPITGGKAVDGYTSYSRRWIWIWGGTQDVRLVAAHEIGHSLMPAAGNSDTEGHTRTGVMRAANALFEWTDEVLALCQKEGACDER